MTPLEVAEPMSIELILLIGAVILAFVHLFLAAAAMTRQYGGKWNASPRDETMPPLQGMAGRLDRAFRNFRETFPFFAVAVLAAEVTGRHNDLTFFGAAIYLAGRIVYLPLYAFGVPVARSIVWGVASLGIILVLFGLLQAA